MLINPRLALIHLHVIATISFTKRNDNGTRESNINYVLNSDPSHEFGCALRSPITFKGLTVSGKATSPARLISSLEHPLLYQTTDEQNQCKPKMRKKGVSNLDLNWCRSLNC